MLHAQLKRSLTDPEYKWLSETKCGDLQLSPHVARFNKRTRTLIVYQVKSTKGPDYSCNADALDSLCELLDERLIRRGCLAQIDPDNSDRVLHVEDCRTVKRNLNG